MSYSYEAYTRDGSPQKGVVDAGSEREAEQKLRSRGLIVTKVAEAGEQTRAKAVSVRRSARSGTKVTVKAMSEFAREFAVLVSTGTPIVDSIESLERQSAGTPLARALEKLRERLEEGE